MHDAHIKRDRYEKVAGQADPAADLRIGVMHSPEPRLLDQFTADGYDLLLAGHTHGGQLCLPFYGALVTNCGIDRERVRGLHRHPADGPGLAARFRRSGHVAVGPGQVRLPPGGHPAHPDAARTALGRLASGWRSGWRSALAMREQARASARLSKSRAVPVRFRAGGV